VPEPATWISESLLACRPMELIANSASFMHCGWDLARVSEPT
jgi:hypothetical protein